ncbi:MAG TPA: hypothetical protein PLE74_05880 [Candidatus Cloacimonadota bacterium]|nr:hypothetical protein [Candidatus Cloacimonadota bacterium]HPT71792.1 hypothetical protein [Candidatus Cloacimonadota bacterium]
MKKFFVILKTIILWFVMIAGLSMIGLTTDYKNKWLVVALYFVFFMLVFGVILFVIRSKQGRIATEKKSFTMVSKIVGIVLILIGILFPAYALGRVQIANLKPNFLVELLITIVLVAVGTFAIRLINNAKSKATVASIGGYVLLIAASAVPGMMISRYDSSSDTIGVVYFAAIFVSVLCWWGYSMIKGHQHEI